jgi:hypothetical protein
MQGIGSVIFIWRLSSPDLETADQRCHAVIVHGRRQEEAGSLACSGDGDVCRGFGCGHFAVGLRQS